MSLILENAVAVTPESVEKRDLYVLNGHFVAERPAHAKSVDLAGHLVFPGLLNAHDHLPLNAIPCPVSIPPQPSSYSWIEEFEPHFAHPEFVAARALSERTRAHHGGLKNLFSGATTVAHHDPWCDAFDETVYPVHVLRRFGWSHSLGLGDTYGPPVAKSYAATPAAAPFFIHLAEGWDMVARAEALRLRDLGALGPNTVLVHGVGLTDDDQRMLLAAGAGVVFCPSSNLFMLGQTLDPRRLCDAGRLALGTDSRFTGARDLLEELRVARGFGDLTPRELLALVTTNAAALLRLPERGGLAPGQLADVVVLRDTGADPYEVLLAATRATLRAVVRGGIPFVTDPDLAAWFEARSVTPRRLTLDGAPKLAHPAVVAVPSALALEPGVTT